VPLTNYQKGDHFEKRILADLRAQGYVAWQSRNSRSVVDIVALKTGQTLLVQVKSGRISMSHDEWNALYDLAGRVSATPVLAGRDGRAISYRQLSGHHQPRSPYWPCEAFVLDEVTS
jgi:Holliday junction resolvase